jgi:hypothetical protein
MVWDMALEQQQQDAASEQDADQQLQGVLDASEPLLQGLAEVARGDEQHRAEIEAQLPQLEANGYHIAGAVQRIWAGERDAEALTAGLDAQDTALVRRALELIEAA